MLGTLERFTDDEIPLGEDDFRAAHVFFRTWIDELT
jgi:hypothetical protein